MRSFIPEHICIDEASVNDPITERVLARFPDVPYNIINSGNSNITGQKPDMESITIGKRMLFLQRSRAPFIERCPGSKNTLCCNYFVANIAVNCHFDCTYCYLQSYLNTQNITVNTNLHDFFAELEALAGISREHDLRIGTGELADSLALDEITGFSTEIVPFFSKFDNLLLELKTKGDFVDNLLLLDPKGRTVIAWSLNPQNIIDTEEYKCASLKERLAAARRCRNAGYKLAFHFDPVILHDGWEKNYRDVVDMMLDYVHPEDILWISLGVLRFTPAGKTVIRKRFPKTNIIYDEMVQCEDGKLRYIQPVRTEIYKKMRSWILDKSPKTFVYLCMETPAVWNRVYGENHPVKNEVLQF